LSASFGKVELLGPNVSSLKAALEAHATKIEAMKADAGGTRARKNKTKKKRNRGGTAGSDEGG